MHKARFGRRKIFNSRNEFSGINLGYDFSANHEWGISGLSRKYDVFPYEPINKISESLTLVEDDKYSYLKDYLFTGTISQIDNILDGPELDIFDENDKSFKSAWDQSHFVIRADKNDTDLIELYEAFKKKDVCFFFSKGGIDDNSLTIAIVSKFVNIIDYKAKYHIKVHYDYKNQLIYHISLKDKTAVFDDSEKNPAAFSVITSIEAETLLEYGAMELVGG